MNVMQKYLKQKHIGIPLVTFSEMRENYGSNYKRLTVIKFHWKHEVKSVSHSTRDTELCSPPNLCFGGKATAQLKAVAPVSANLLRIQLTTGGI
jgi:hypothetical protein